MKTLSLKVPDELDREILELARRKGWSKSRVIRRAIAAYAPRGGRVSRGSFLARAEDLIGSVSGPPDLSSNPARLKRFGR
jgi:hypothetical protein